MAKGGDIKNLYCRYGARVFGISEHIRYQHEVQQLSWSSHSQQWTATVKNHVSGEVFALTAKFVVGATGYYDYEQGYRPHFENEAHFKVKSSIRSIGKTSIMTIKKVGHNR